jgi:hypothetical protein
MRRETNAPSLPLNSVPQPDARDLIQTRIDGVSAWLSENAPNCRAEQKHLDEGAVERQYWHFGYLFALHDIQKLLGLNVDTLN